MTTDMTPTGATSSPPTIHRVLDLGTLLAKKSHFLFGPRQTGKTFLVRATLPAARCTICSTARST